MSDSPKPLTILGAPDAEACVDDACLIPTALVEEIAVTELSLLVEEIAEGDRLETSGS
ncbi:MAG: hypothetical protein KF680_05245 [Cryobacterium sp.]|nr:hypothetical protein [Cryobacterium sp.]